MNGLIQKRLDEKWNDVFRLLPTRVNGSTSKVLFDYYKKDKGFGEEFKRIEDKDLKSMQLKLPQDLKGVLNLEQHWNEG